MFRLEANVLTFTVRFSLQQLYADELTSSAYLYEMNAPPDPLSTILFTNEFASLVECLFAVTNGLYYSVWP